MRGVLLLTISATQGTDGGVGEKDYRNSFPPEEYVVVVLYVSAVLCRQFSVHRLRKRSPTISIQYREFRLT